MTDNGVMPKAQDDIVKFISSFALYGFPESFGVFRLPRICKCVPESPVSGCIYGRAPEQLANGFLLALNSCKGRTTAWIQSKAN